MSVTSKERLLAKLATSKPYRDAYVAEHVKTSMPLHLRHLREERALSQAALAAQAQTTQTVISRLEDPQYGNLTVQSLLKIAAALNIALLVKFVPFSRLLAEGEDRSPRALSVPSFDEELALLQAWATRTKKGRRRPRKNTMSAHHDQHIRQNYDAFMEQLPHLAFTQRGKYALLHATRIIACFDTARDAYIAGQQLFPAQVFSVQEVTETPVDLG